MNSPALFFVTHGSRDHRSWLALQNFVEVARAQSDRFIGGGCLEGQEMTLAEQLEKFAIEVFHRGGLEIVILPLFLLAGVHVSEDIPSEVAIAQTNLQRKFHNKFVFHITTYLGTNFQIPSLLQQHFDNHVDKKAPDNQGRILIAHGSRRFGANQAVEDLAVKSNAIAAYWGVEPKIESQIENLLAQGMNNINVLPYFLTEGGITEAISKKIQIYSDRAQIKQLPVPLSSRQIVDLSLEFI